MTQSSGHFRMFMLFGRRSVLFKMAVGVRWALTLNIKITQIKGISPRACLCVLVPPHAPLCLHIRLRGVYIRQHVHTFMCVWVGTAAAYSLGPAPPRWWLTAAISFLSEWVYNPCYNAVIIQYAYICLALTKHVQSQSNSSAPAVYLISLYYNITLGPLVATFIQRGFTMLWLQSVAWQEIGLQFPTVSAPRYTFQISVSFTAMD